jgi:branched-chain amino acid transport system permease protein
MTMLNRALPWILLALGFVLAPKILSSNTAITMLAMMSINIVFALSYNMLLGQTGLLSFGHAVYYGLAGFFAIHAMNYVVRDKLGVPLPFIPIVGGLAGLFFAFVFGWVSTKRAGTVFSMISLGLGELVAASSLILRTFFGGEEGVTANRTKLPAFFGYKFGPQIEVYYLIAIWTFICIVLMYLLTRTPFGRMCNAVRENPERAEFVGYSTQRVRFIAFCLSGFFAGVAGALAAINFEIMNAHSIGAAQSGAVLLMTYAGGAGYFFGPIIGAIIITWLQITLSDVTGAWMLYFGLLFILVVMFSPGGIAGWIMMHEPVWRARRIGRLVPAYALAAIPMALVIGGAIFIIELAHHQLVKAAMESPAMHVFGMTLQSNAVGTWLGALAIFAAGVIGLKLVWSKVSDAWGDALLDEKKEARR